MYKQIKKASEYRVKNSRNLIFAVLSIIILAVITTTIIILSSQYIVQQAESRLDAVMLEAESIHQYVQKNMHPTMYDLKEEGRMPQGFYSPAILSSSYITRHVFQHFNQTRKLNNLPQVEYKMAATNPRNKINLADSLETELLNLFNNDSTITKYTGIIEEHGVKHLYYAKPFLRVENKCLKCHGEKENAPYELSQYYNWDSGFDWEVGVIPAIEVIKTPLVGEFKTSSKIIVLVLFTAIILLILILLNSRLSRKNEIIKNQRNEMGKTLDQLKEAQTHLVQTEKMASLGTLTAGVAHEINNPLNYIMGGYNGLDNFFKDNPDLSNEDIPVLLSGIKHGLERTTKIVKGLNQFSRDKQTHDESCDVHAIIDNCLLMVHNQIKHHIEIKKNYTKEPAVILGNVGKLHQVFINILTNAVQAIEDEGEILIVTIKANDQILIEITDSGCGISDEHILNITDPFYTTKAPGEGTGLGLSITYTLIHEHKGDLDIVSEIGKGTTVKVKLPYNH